MMDLEDGAILKATTQIAEEDGSISLSINLPGREAPLRSTPMAGKLSSEILIQWCESVRDQVRADERAREEEMEAKRQARKRAGMASPREHPGDALSQQEETAQPTLSEDGVSPDEFLQGQAEKGRRDVAILEDRRDRIVERLAKAIEDLAKWEKMAEAAGIELPEETDNE